MFKKLLSTVAAASIIASALSGFTLVSAEGNVNVTDCNIENGSENTNTSAIVLTFDGNVNSTDLSNAVKITDAAGTSCEFTVTSKDNMAQIGIIGASKNTTYTMSVEAGADVGDGVLGQAFTRSFATGNTIYTSSWSTLGNNSERINDIGGWHGEFTDTANGIKFTDEILVDYPLESAASEGVIEVEYERYIPSYTTDAEGKFTETETSFPNYGILDRVYLDNGKTAQFFSIYGSNARITKDAWHTYRYVIDIPNKTYKFYLDGKLTSLDTDPDLTDASYVSKIRFQAGGGGSYNREMWVRNVRTVRRNDPGSWTGSEVSVKDGIATITVPNNAPVVDGVVQQVLAENYYVLKNPITSRAKISFEYKANESAKDSDKASDYAKTSIRFYPGSGSSGIATSVCYPFNYPKINYWADPKVIFNLPSGVSELAADSWHKVEYVFDFDTVNNKRILKYASVDGAETLCDFKTSNAALGNIAFFIKKRSSDDGDNVLQVKNINVIENYSVADKIAITPSFANGGTNIDPNTVKLSFSAPIAQEDVSLFALYDEDGEAIDTSLYSFSLDSTYKVLSLTMENYELNKTYNINITGTVDGYLGGTISAVGEGGLYFTTPTAEVITGKWSRSYNNAKIKSSMTAENGVTTFNVQNIGEAEEGKYQISRDSYAYAFTTPVTGTNVPLTIKYKFKANEALSLSESTMRFYPYEHADMGGICICVDFPYTKPRFRWDGITFNLPNAATTIAPNEWHEAEYAFNVDSTDGTTMLYAIIDGVITFTNYKKAATKQLQSIDLFFYGTDNSADDFKLEIKDMEITRAASEFDVTASNNNLTSDNNKIQVDFVSPVSEDSMKTGIKVLSGTTEVVGAITGYDLSSDGLSAKLTIGGLNTTGEYTLSFASLQDCYGRTPKTQKFNFTYTAPKQEGIVEITGGNQTVTDNIVTVKAVLSNGTFSEVNGKLIVAAYNKTTNKLVAIDVVDVTNLAAEAANVEKTAEFAKPDGEYTVKVMLWDNLTNMKAICDSYTIN